MPAEEHYNDQVGQLLRSESISLSSILKPVTCQSESSQSNTLAMVAELTRQVDQTEELKGLGVKLYYGDTKVNSKVEASGDDDAKGRSCARDLLNHVISGLAAIQHCGDMIIKVHETHDPFTVGIIFALYNLFQKVVVVKPYATSFLSSRQYLVCQGLKQRRP